ncbi:MAG: hypothetical protein HYT48_00835 [Candidatus Vogelbacteria bacterium]|nr:hypothetical protein [Candidatus Vogelbacteria bacterium]
MAIFQLVSLSEADIGRILELEYKVCIPPLQVSAERLQQRFSVGNMMLGVARSSADPTLVSTIGFRYASFSPDNREAFPKRFAEFSTPATVPVNYNAAFVYSFNVDPEERTRGQGFRICRQLLPIAVKMVKDAGCKYVVADGRPSSYNGSKEYHQEFHPRILEFKQAIDRFLEGGPFPPEKVLFLEPTWRVYKHFVPSLKPLWVLREFFPPDVPANGLRVILCGEI